MEYFSLNRSDITRLVVSIIQDVLDRWLLLPRKLLIQWFLLVKFKSSLRKVLWNDAIYKWKVHNEKIEIISFVVTSFVLNRPSLSISRCMSMHETDLAVSKDYSLIWRLNIMILCVISMFIYVSDCIGLRNIVIMKYMYMYLAMLYPRTELGLRRRLIVEYKSNLYSWIMHVQMYIMYEEFEDTKGAIRIRISKKNRQHNGQKKKVEVCSSLKIIVLYEDLILWYYVLSLCLNMFVIVLDYATLWLWSTCINALSNKWFEFEFEYCMILTFTPVTWGKLNIFKSWISEWVGFF
jgi:hypothetical protein